MQFTYSTDPQLTSLSKPREVNFFKIENNKEVSVLFNC